MNTVLLFSFASAMPLSPQVAAERFAASYWTDRRSIKNATIPADRPDCLDFQIVGGRGVWYRASPTGDGWQISMAMPYRQDPS
jgi:hypothetical protein